MPTTRLRGARWVHRSRPLARRSPWIVGIAFVLAVAASGPRAGAGEGPAADRFRAEVEPILMDYCYGCHGEGMKKGGIALDELRFEGAASEDHDAWWKVLKNVRAGIMPPPGKPRPGPEEVRALEDWIKRGAFGLDPWDPDPGRVTIRRLNRVEYRNTIRDLMGIEFKTEEEFPPDDTGYGFDNIGDVLSISPLLLEKYMQAAEAIVAQAVPTVSKVVQVREVRGPQFRKPDGGRGPERLSVYEPATLSHTIRAEQDGRYRLVVNLVVHGAFDFDPGRCRLVFKADDRELLSEEFAWEDGKKHGFEFEEQWQPGEHKLSFELKPLTPPDQKKTSVDLRIASVRVEGPMEPEKWARPKNFDRFFSEDDPGTAEGRRRYAREVLGRFAGKAFRRPIEEKTLGRLVTIAEEVYSLPGKSVEDGLARAMVAVLSSPRFLFRVETIDPADAGRAHPPVDEYSLASRLSYFLWSTMPDEELFRLAGRGELRRNLDAQVRRMMADPRSEMLIRNFAGQWLEIRDVEGIAIDARSILSRDDGDEKELQQEMEDFRAFLAERAAQKEKEAAQKEKDKEKEKEAAQQDKGAPRKDAAQQDKEKARPERGKSSPRARFAKLFGKPRVEMDGPLRSAMRRETEMFFDHVVREDRSVLDFLDSDYTFVNERLAKHYGLPGVKGSEMRRVTLPAGSPRGGLLTQGTVLVVTSNPTRTSPVKRGLFILDNIMGTPPPPPPADIPQLEDAEKEFKDREPTLREVLELHRAKPLCRSCHARMDPLGLALENFNAMGMWRDQERKQPLEVKGKLVTGEEFADIRALKRVLKEEHRAEFYRCLTEKFLTFALGRGLEYYDVESVDQIVARLERERGRFSALLTGVIESAPFQRRRGVTAATNTATAMAPRRPAPGPETPRQP